MAISERRRWLRRLVEQFEAGASAAVPHTVVEAVARRVGGGDVPLLNDVDDPPDGWADPWLIGSVHEVLASAGERSDRGAWYTPRPVVEHLVEQALPHPVELGGHLAFVVDPTCGGGAFLLATLDRFVEIGVDPDDALEHIGGIDIDAGAVRASQLAIEAWGRLCGASVSAIERAVDRVSTGDQLEGWPDSWPPVDVVVGNPPFATPLRGRPFPKAAHLAREARRDRLGPYADLAAIHLAVCVERVAAHGRVGLVLPQSILAGRDTAGLRAWIDDVAPMATIWATREPVFEASVRVWSPLLVKGSANGSPKTVTGSPIGESRIVSASWSEVAASALGVPRVRLTSVGTLDTLLTSATAGFRDEFYALAEACVELSDLGPSGELPEGFMRLATVGSLDPLTSWWGRRPTTFAKRRWDQPVIDGARVEGRSAVWLEQMRVPKVLLPTQSRVFEPFVDRDGTVAPATPLLALRSEAAAIDLVAAVLLAPPVVAWAFARWFGTAMSVDALKIAARDVGQLPLPHDRGAWNEAAAMVASADHREPALTLPLAIEAARVMHRAYGLHPKDADGEAVWQWWLARADALLASRP